MGLLAAPSIQKDGSRHADEKKRNAKRTGMGPT